jgi:hypothetical protein
MGNYSSYLSLSDEVLARFHGLSYNTDKAFWQDGRTKPYTTLLLGPQAAGKSSLIMFVLNVAYFLVGPRVPDAERKKTKDFSKWDTMWREFTQTGDASLDHRTLYYSEFPELYRNRWPFVFMDSRGLTHAAMGEAAADPPPAPGLQQCTTMLDHMAIGRHGAASAACVNDIHSEREGNRVYMFVRVFVCVYMCVCLCVCVCVCVRLVNAAEKRNMGKLLTGWYVRHPAPAEGRVDPRPFRSPERSIDVVIVVIDLDHVSVQADFDLCKLTFEYAKSMGRSARQRYAQVDSVCAVRQSCV